MSVCGECGKFNSSPAHLKNCKSKKESTKIDISGFHNRWGESNCFLNSALQIL